ncbi:cleft lip and palate transmembrane protein 1 protein, partial [Cystoisospora suis]
KERPFLREKKQVPLRISGDLIDAWSLFNQTYKYERWSSSIERNLTFVAPEQLLLQPVFDDELIGRQ